MAKLCIGIENSAVSAPRPWPETPADHEQCNEPALAQNEALARVLSAYEGWEAGEEFQNFPTEVLRSVEQSGKQLPPGMSLFIGLNWLEHQNCDAAAPHYVCALRARGAQWWELSEEYDCMGTAARRWWNQPLCDILKLPDAQAEGAMKSLLEQQAARAKAIVAAAAEAEAAASRKRAARFQPEPVPVRTAALFLRTQHACASPQRMQAALFYADAVCVKNFGCCLFKERPRVVEHGVIFDDAVDVESDGATDSSAECPHLCQRLLAAAVEYLPHSVDAIAKLVRREPARLASVQGGVLAEDRMQRCYGTSDRGTRALREMNERLQSR